MNTLRLGYGPLLLLLYQTAPVGVQQDSLGRYRVSVGYATGQWEQEAFGCDGQLISATPIRQRSGGIQMDAWPDDHFRVSGFAGRTSQSVGVTEIVDSSYGGDLIEAIVGTFGGVQLAYEGDHLGVGIGVTHMPSYEEGDWPSLYIRHGVLDGLHVRMDLFTPHPALPSVGVASFGIGNNNGHLRRVGWFVGVAVGPPQYNSKAAYTGELHFPVGRQLTARLHALAGPGERNSQWSFGGALQYDFGARH